MCFPKGWGTLCSFPEASHRTRSCEFPTPSWTLIRNTQNKSRFSGFMEPKASSSACRFIMLTACGSSESFITSASLAHLCFVQTQKVCDGMPNCNLCLWQIVQMRHLLSLRFGPGCHIKQLVMDTASPLLPQAPVFVQSRFRSCYCMVIVLGEHSAKKWGPLGHFGHSSWQCVHFKALHLKHSGTASSNKLR